MESGDSAGERCPGVAIFCRHDEFTEETGSATDEDGWATWQESEARMVCKAAPCRIEVYGMKWAQPEWNKKPGLADVLRTAMQIACARCHGNVPVTRDPKRPSEIPATLTRFGGFQLLRP